MFLDRRWQHLSVDVRLNTAPVKLSKLAVPKKMPKARAEWGDVQFN